MLNTLQNYSTVDMTKKYGHSLRKEIWALFEIGKLQPDTELTGYFEENTQAADVDGVILEIKSILAEEQERRLREEDD